MGELESRSSLIKKALVGIACLIGGILILSVGGFGFIAALIIGGITAVIGLSLMASKDAFIGLLVFVSGALILITKIPIIGTLASILIVIGGWVLIVTGVISIIFFLINVVKRM
jgi:hypothetical protein